ncbi:unnamed protein product [Phaeothamnion confervicola]
MGCTASTHQETQVDTRNLKDLLEAADLSPNYGTHKTKLKVSSEKTLTSASSTPCSSPPTSSEPSPAFEPSSPLSTTSSDKLGSLADSADIEDDDEALRSMCSLEELNTTEVPFLVACAEALDYNKVRLLLESGEEDVNAVDGEGNTSLHFAAAQGHESLTWLLLSNGANVCYKNDIFQDSCLHESARGGHVRVVQMLLDSSADANAANEDGDTPMHTACTWSRPEVVRVLIDFGAAIDVKNAQGLTPLQIAEQKGDIVSVEILKAAA